MKGIDLAAGILKKAVCLLCGALLLTGCGSGGSGETTDSGSMISSAGVPLAAVVSERLNKENYEVTLKISGETSDGVESRIVRYGNNGLVAMTSDGVYSEFYTINGKSYMLLPVIKCYRIIEGNGVFGNAFIRLGDGDMLHDITETDTEITEVYKPSDPILKETYYFTFDKATHEIRRAVTEGEGQAPVVTEVESIKWSADEIKLPDISGWDDISDVVTDITSVKYILYKQGISPDMVEKAGYKYDDLAKLSDEELDAAAEKIKSVNS